MVCLRKISVKGGLLLALVALLAGVYQWYMTEQGNFHVITPGVAYRSGQLDQDELEYYARHNQIKTVINLRGTHDGKPWYDEEAATCRRLGILHKDVSLSSVEAPSRATACELLQIMRTAPRPVLLHCEGGADRTGLAAALWKAEIEGVAPGIARKQLSVWYGHLPFGRVQVLDAFFESCIQHPLYEQDIYLSAMKGPGRGYVTE